MKVSEKVTRAKEVIRFISTHDDAPLEEVASALDELTKFIDVEKHAAEKRRAKIEEKNKAEQTRKDKELKQAAESKARSSIDLKIHNDDYGEE